jgi:TnpA family transposase
MPRRVTLTDRQKDALLRLPTSQADLLKHYTLSDEDLGHIGQRRRPHNRFGFALQLCVLRYPGRVLAPGELIPAEVVEFMSRPSDGSTSTLPENIVGQSLSVGFRPLPQTTPGPAWCR